MDDAEGANRIREFLQGFRIEFAAGLVGVGNDLVNGNVVDGGGIAADDPVDLPGTLQRVDVTQKGAETPS